MKHLIIILFSLFLISCYNQKDDCNSDFEYSIKPLETSVQKFEFYENFEDIKYKNEENEEIELTISRKTDSIQVLVRRECLVIPSQSGEFRTMRIRELLKLQTENQTDTVSIIMSIYSSYNHNNPSQISDRMSIYYDWGTDKEITGFEYVIDKRSDLTTDNKKLGFLDSLTLNEKVFYDINTFENDKYAIVFNETLGLIKFKSKSNNHTIILN